MKTVGVPRLASSPGNARMHNARKKRAQLRDVHAHLSMRSLTSCDRVLSITVIAGRTLIKRGMRSREGRGRRGGSVIASITIYRLTGLDVNQALSRIDTNVGGPWQFGIISIVMVVASINRF